MSSGVHSGLASKWWPPATPVRLHALSSGLGLRATACLHACIAQASNKCSTRCNPLVCARLHSSTLLHARIVNK